MVFLLVVAGPSGVGAEEPSRPVLAGEEAERFLRTAEVVDRRALGDGITFPDQLTLSDGVRTARAVWKTINEQKHGATQLASGRVLVGFADSWKHEVAAYELDKLLGTGLVPPTVERKIGRTTGSVQLWVEESMTEADRKAKAIAPPDLQLWNDQMHTLRILHQLTDNTDSRNISNVLVDPSFRVYAVDFSRAFTLYGELRSPEGLERFSRPVLEALAALDRPTLKERLGRWLSGPRIEALLKRRDRILALASRLARERGEENVLYP
jgi:hypothetical protein